MLWQIQLRSGFPYTLAFCEAAITLILYIRQISVNISNIFRYQVWMEAIGTELAMERKTWTE